MSATPQQPDLSVVTNFANGKSLKELLPMTLLAFVCLEMPRIVIFYGSDGEIRPRTVGLNWDDDENDNNSVN